MLASLAGIGSAAFSTSVLALPAKTLVFPRDRGAHPAFRTEWWYITGQASTEAASPRRFGFQLTFFRSRVDGTAQMTSAFAARQLIFAHAAVTDVQGGKLWHDQRIAREGFGVASASQQDMALKLRDWTLSANGPRYTAELPATDFGLSLQFEETQSNLLQGKQGLSRKGPEEKQASYYYSQPQLATRGRLQIKDQTFEVTGKAWLDHEWSEEILAPGAVGWDWMGMNLHDGSALTAFRLRRADGSALWAGGSLRLPGQAARIFAPEEVVFTPLRYWVSPLQGTRYPVQWRVATPAGTFEVRALLDNQELDSRASTGAVYWEGICALHDNAVAGSGALRGHGYLEMTGYAQTLRL